MLFQSVLLFIIIFLTIGWYVRKHHNYWNERGVAYKKPFPFIGNLEFMLRRSICDFFNDLRKKYPSDYIGVYLGLKPALVIQTSELARRVLVKDADHFQDRYIFSSSSSDPLGSLNLFTVKNPMWSIMRQELSPMFTSARLKMLCELMNQNASELVRKIKRDHVDGNKTVNLKDLFSMYTSDTVGYTTFGLRVSALKDKTSPLWLIACHIVKYTFWRGFEFFMIFFLPSIASLLRLQFFSAPATKYIKKLFWDVAEKREETRTENDRDLLHLLLKLRDNMKLPANSDPKLADELMLAQAAVFILGSIETSSTTLSYCCHELAHHPEEQEKLYRAVDEALKQKGKDVLEYEDLLETKYLGSCIYETLRKYPTLAYLDRVCNKRYKLTDDVTIEPGIPVLVNIFALHYNEEQYPQPEEWRPDRSAVATSDNDNLQYNYLPFGEGPRFCIGKRLGMLQVRAAMAQLIHNYELRPGPGPYEPHFDPYSVITAPYDGGCVQFIPRKK